MSVVTTHRQLTETQHRAVCALLAGDSGSTVAHACGISDRTLREWQRRPEFQAALQEGRDRILQAVCAQVATAAAGAVHTLIQISQDFRERGSVRIAAAGKLLNFLLRSSSLAVSPAERAAAASVSTLTPEQLLALLAPTPAPGPEPADPLPSPPSPPCLAAETGASTPPVAVPSCSNADRLVQSLARLGRPEVPSRRPSRPFRELPLDDYPERPLSLQVPVAAR